MHRELDEYSLWLEPQGEEHDTLAEVIRGIAEELGTPVFMPHVTLLGGIPRSAGEISFGMGKLSQNLPSFPLTLSALAIGTNKYQCLIAVCAENRKLSVFNRRAQKLFGVNEAYQPHMSLMYGDVELKKKKLLKAQLESSLRLPLTFEVSMLSLWHIKGSADHWQKVSEVGLF